VFLFVAIFWYYFLFVFICNYYFIFLHMNFYFFICFPIFHYFSLFFFIFQPAVVCILVVCLLEATNDNKIKPLVIKTIFSDLKINYISLYNAIKILPNIDFEADPINKIKPLIIKTIFPISKSIKFPYITQLKHCHFFFEAGPNKKLKALILKKKTKKIGRTLIINTPG